MFPSPYGDIFLKFINEIGDLGLGFDVSVPLRGYFFEILGV